MTGGNVYLGSLSTARLAVSSAAVSANTTTVALNTTTPAAGTPIINSTLAPQAGRKVVIPGTSCGTFTSASTGFTLTPVSGSTGTSYKAVAYAVESAGGATYACINY